jgi:hypothetical protein
VENDSPKAPPVPQRQRQPRRGEEQQRDGHQPAGEPAKLAELEGAVLHDPTAA